jgi:hypothetical protein
MEINSLAALLFVILLPVLVVLWLLSELERYRWRCSHPGCDFETLSEREALGHQADHQRHRMTQE